MWLPKNLFYQMEQLAQWFCVNVLFRLDECGEGLQSEASNFAVDDVIAKHHPCSLYLVQPNSNVSLPFR